MPLTRSCRKPTWPSSENRFAWWISHHGNPVASSPTWRSSGGAEARPTRGEVAKPAGETLTREPVAIPLPSVATEVRDVWIEILRLPKKSPVSVIEVLSPTNKTGDGFAECRLKRGKLIRRKVHLIEFDFLLAGSRLPMDRELPAGDLLRHGRAGRAAPIATSTPGRSGIAYRQSRSRFWHGSRHCTRPGRGLRHGL